MLEAAVHVLVFHDVGFLEQVFSPEPHEVWMRLTIVAMFIGFGIYSQWIVNARWRAERVAVRANTELTQIFDTAADAMRVVDNRYIMQNKDGWIQKCKWKPLALLILGLYCLVLATNIVTHPNRFHWDFVVRYYGALAHAEGHNAYDHKDLKMLVDIPSSFGDPRGFRNTWTPIILEPFRILTFFKYSIASHLFLFFKILALGLLVLLWKKHFLKHETGIIFYFFCLFAFNNAIYVDVSAGNISVFEQLFIWIGFFYFLKKRYTLFCTFIIVAALPKIVPLVLLCLLLFSSDQRKFYHFFGSIIIFLSVHLLYGVLYPDTTLAFIKSVFGLRTEFTANPATLPFILDTFDKIGRLTGLSSSSSYSFSIFALIILGIGFIYWRSMLKLQKNDFVEKDKISIYITCLFYGLIMPRFKDYSYILLIIPTYCLIEHFRFKKTFWLLFILAVLPQYSTLLFLRKFSLPVSPFYPLFVAYGIGIIYLMGIYKSIDLFKTDRKLE